MSRPSESVAMVRCQGVRLGPMLSWATLHRCLGTQPAPGSSLGSHPPNLPLPSALQVFERSSVSSLPPTPRRQPIPTLLSPPGPGVPWGLSSGLPMEGNRPLGPPRTSHGSLCLFLHSFLFRTSHANPLTRHAHQPLCHCPSFTPVDSPSRTRQGQHAISQLVPPRGFPGGLSGRLQSGCPV